MLRAFPLLFVIVVVYNLVIFGGAGFGGSADGEAFSPHDFMESALFSFAMPSGSVWTLDYGDVFVMISLLLLFVEVMRSTWTDNTALINHGLSLAVMVMCVVEFISVPGFATSTFFFITFMTVIDVVAGFAISFFGVRHDASIVTR